MLKKISLSFVLIFLLSNISLLAGDLESHWAKADFKIDGSLDEWGDYSLEHFEDDKFSVGVRNDSSFLYLMFVTRDQYLVRMAQMSGLKVWLNGKGKKDKNFGLLYYPDFGQDTILFKMNPMGGPQPQVNMPDRSEEQKKRLGNKFVVDEDNNRSENDSRLYYTTFSSGIYKGVYLIEMRFELNGDEVLNDYLSAKPKDKIAVCFELGGDLREQMKAMGGAPPGGMRGGGDDFGGGGGMGGMGGGRGGGRPGGMGGQRPGLTKLDKWVKIKLAGNK